MAAESRSVGGMARPFPLAPHPVDMSELDAGFRLPPPTLGQHTDEILRELGLSAQAIAELRDQRVV